MFVHRSAHLNKFENLLLMLIGILLIVLIFGIIRIFIFLIAVFLIAVAIIILIFFVRRRSVVRLRTLERGVFVVAKISLAGWFAPKCRR